MWGTADFFGGLTSRRLPALAVYGWSQLFGLFALVMAVIITGSWQSSMGYLPWSIAGSLAGIVGMYSFYRALAIGPMGIVSPLVALSVVIPVGFGLLRGELPTSIQILGILIAVVGVLLASGPELGGSGSMRPLAYSAVALICFGIMFVTISEGSKVNALMTMTGMRATSMVLFAAIIIVARNVGGVTARDLPVLAAIGLLDAAANVTFGVASTMGLLSTTSVLGSLYPVVTALLAAIVLHERLKLVQYVGVGAAMVGVVLLSAGGA